MLHKKSLVLGSSKGLGLEIFESLEDCTGVSRTGLGDQKLDLSKSESASEVTDIIKENSINRVFYVAGGGPHGDFLSKPWQSHEWAFNVNAKTPLKIMESLPDNVEFVYIGSAIAERSESNSSLSYSWSKKLVKEVILKSKNESLLIFSPPYMDTGLLPANAWPRRVCPELVLCPELVAKELLNWLKSRDSDDRCFDWMERFPYALPKDFEI